MTELGIYGGTFAPVHNGHVWAAHRLLEVCSLDTLLLIPTRRPPHKQIPESDNPAHRLAMLHRAFPEADSPESRIRISRFELDSPPPSYTARTLEHFSAPNVNLTFFCGTDMFLTMDTWYQPERIFALARIAHIPRLHLTREDHEQIAQKTAQYECEYGACIQHPSITPYPLSSTDVRDCIAQGKPITDLVPVAVARYIDEHGLYREGIS